MSKVPKIKVLIQATVEAYINTSSIPTENVVVTFSHRLTSNGTFKVSTNKTNGKSQIIMNSSSGNSYIYLDLTDASKLTFKKVRDYVCIDVSVEVAPTAIPADAPTVTGNNLVPVTQQQTAQPF